MARTPGTGDPSGDAPASDPRLVPDPDHPGAWFVRVDGTDQSWVDPDDPTRLEFDYLQRIADVIDAAAFPRERLRVIHLGGAGMSLARYVAHTRPTSPQIVCEPDASLTEAVRSVVPLPKRSGIKVRPVDARSGVAAMPDDYADVVILDAFAGARVPAELTTTEFFDDVARILRPAGTFVINITDHTPFAYSRRVAATAASLGDVLVSAEPATLRGRRFGNIIVTVRRGAALPAVELARAAAGSVFPYRLLYGDHVERWIGGARPFTDLDAEPSPTPPDGPLTFR